MYQRVYLTQAATMWFVSLPVQAAVFLLAAGHWSGLVFVLSPVLMTRTLAKGTGAPLTEKRMSSSRRGYAEYVRRTSGFVPRPPRKA